MAIRAITFDFGNVVGFFDYRPSLRQLAVETGIDETLLRRTLLDAEVEDQFESGLMGGEEYIGRMGEALGPCCRPDRLRELVANIFQPNHDVCRLIPRLRGRVRLLLGSNTNEIHSRHFRRQFADTLAHFDHLVLSHEIGQRKPRREFFEHCLRHAGSPADECLFIDDLPANIEGARSCGWHAILYRDYPDLERQLAALGVTMD
jgi:putative hydrolase of the HAD superfamily